MKLFGVFLLLVFSSTASAQTLTGHISAAITPGSKRMQCIYEMEVGNKVYSGLNRGLHGGCDLSLVGKDFSVALDKKRLTVTLPDHVMRLEVIAVEERK